MEHDLINMFLCEIKTLFTGLNTQITQYCGVHIPKLGAENLFGQYKIKRLRLNACHRPEKPEQLGWLCAFTTALLHKNGIMSKVTAKTVKSRR